MGMFSERLLLPDSKQTELLLCLMPSTDVQTSLQRYRSTVLTEHGILPVLPVIIPLVFIKELPSFHVSRHLATTSWQPESVPADLSLVATVNSQNVVIKIDQNAWDGFITALHLLSAIHIETDTHIVHSCALGPWILLADISSNIQKIQPLLTSATTVIPAFSVRKVSLAVLRITTARTEAMEATRWELMGTWKVPIK